MKVKPMINGIEVKVGQVWKDFSGATRTVVNVYSDGTFSDSYGFVYGCQGTNINEYKEYSFCKLIKDVETTYGVTPTDFPVKLRKVQAEIKPKATFTESEINAKINQVIKDFDWQKAVSVYTALGWAWYEVEDVPTIGDLVVAGAELMKQAVRIAVANQDEGCASSGGLIGRAYITDGKLAISLEMQVTEASSGY